MAVDLEDLEDLRCVIIIVVIVMITITIATTTAELNYVHACHKGEILYVSATQHTGIS